MCTLNCAVLQQRLELLIHSPPLSMNMALQVEHLHYTHTAALH
jgi:hypothetical protein